MTSVCLALLLIFQLLQTNAARADELRPAYLAMREIGPSEFAVTWKVPAVGDFGPGLSVRFPEACKAKSDPVRGTDAGAFFERSTVLCSPEIRGQEIIVDGLATTSADVLARIEYQGGSTQIARLSAGSPSFVVVGSQSRLDVSKTYLFLGIEHILTSLDHLLFVLALVFLIGNRRKLVTTITAFTIAHSITLAGAALGYLSLPQPPVEATIALSIAFLASELIKSGRGEKRLSETYPWAISFSFGLLHGFGFAGALKEIGLPQVDVPLALLTFNAGVEIGQLLFVLVVVAGMAAARRLFDLPVVPLRLTAAYLIGTTSFVWLMSRLSEF